MSLTFSPNSSNTWKLLFFSYNVLWWSLKICLLKKFPNSEKSNSITIVIFDKPIHILYRLSLHGLIFKYNKVLKYLYGRGKVLVYDKMAKMTNFWKISHFSHFSKNGDFWKKSGLAIFSLCYFLEKVTTFWKVKKSRFFLADFSAKRKNRDFLKSRQFFEEFFNTSFYNSVCPSPWFWCHMGGHKLYFS